MFRQKKFPAWQFWRGTSDMSPPLPPPLFMYNVAHNIFKKKPLMRWSH